MPGKTRPLNPREQELKERLNIPGLGPFEEISSTLPVNMPPIERAPMFRPQTKLLGMGTFEENELEKLYRLAPQLRGRAGTITKGIGPMYMNVIGDNDVALARNAPTGMSGIAGLTGWSGKNKGNIEIDNYLNSDFIGSLAHEFGHVLGLRQKEKLQANSSLLGMLLNPNAIKNDPIVQWGTDEPDLKPGFGTYHTGALADKNYYPLTHEKDIMLPSEAKYMPGLGRITDAALPLKKKAKK